MPWNCLCSNKEKRRPQISAPILNVSFDLYILSCMLFLDIIFTSLNKQECFSEFVKLSQYIYF